jgi:hypothetical protein
VPPGFEVEAISRDDYQQRTEERGEAATENVNGELPGQYR